MGDGTSQELPSPKANIQMTYSSKPLLQNATPITKKRKNLRAVCRWLRERISNIDFGVKYTDRYGRTHPIHCNINDDIIAAVNREPDAPWLAKLTNEKIGRHLADEDTFYFTAASHKETETLLCIDIDCHKTGTLAGAQAFASHLREKLFPNLYYEVSTNGNGVHAYLIVQKDGHPAQFLNMLFKELQKRLRKELSDTDFDVQDVEIKGTCPVMVWHEGKLTNHVAGSLAKLPRGLLTRFEELTQTTRLNTRDLMRLQVSDRNTPTPTVSITNSSPRIRIATPVMSGSMSGRVISEDELQELSGHYRSLATRLMETHSIKTSTRAIATEDDVSIFLMLLKYFTENMNADGSLPWARFKGMWEVLFATGSVSRPWNCCRFAAVRDYLSSLNLLDWQDNSFTIGTNGSILSWSAWQTTATTRDIHTQSLICRTDDGVSSRMDRVKALGNSVIPQIPAQIFTRLRLCGIIAPAIGV